jgi:GH15 family glucan-1,4-alpha-glucosidase
VACHIEEYAFLSDTESAALVGIDGSVDWLTFPRFDSPACFAALLGDPGNGRWRLAPRDEVVDVSRRYRSGTLVLDTEMRIARGLVRITDCMPIRSDGRLDLVRQVRLLEGEVPMQMHFTARMDYGSIVPWVTRTGEGLRFVAGPDALLLSTDVELRADGLATVASFDPEAGRPNTFSLVWAPSYGDPPHPVEVASAIEETCAWWTAWSTRRSRFRHYDDAIGSSAVVLKGLTYEPTGGIVAAATTSLPEALGGSRNWDYRYCWLRDATFTLTSLLDLGYSHEATAWRDWLLRAVAGSPDRVQIMYGPAGEHRLDERALPWLDGYACSTPVRIGNDAHGQFQLDVYGEVLDAFCQAELVRGHPDAWAVGKGLADVVCDRWTEPDDGLWEMRGDRRHFTHSKVMAWVALDRALKLADQIGAADRGDVLRWTVERERVRKAVLAEGVDERGVFVQELGGTALDASLLMVPLVGFLPADDPRVVATTDALVEQLGDGGFLHRYDPEQVDDGVGGQEGAFLLCSLWLAEVYALQHRLAEAQQTYEQVLGVANDVGLLSEMYDPSSGRLLGNLPQAFSHTGIVAAGVALDHVLSGDDEPPIRRSPS